MIKITNLSKKFGKLTVLDDLSFEIDKPGIFAILGPNGSGKTTILKTVLGMVIPQSGQVFFDDQMILGSWDYRQQIGYLPQIARFPDNLSVQELINMIKDIRGGEADETALVNRFRLQPFLDKKLGNLSGGTRQKVNIVLTFMFDAQVLVLDEPTAGLDPVSMIDLKQLIQEEKAKGRIILITTHIMPLVEELADEILFLLDGKMYFQGTIDELGKKTGKQNLEHSIASIVS
jgi:Cu-processing system ATP-binding protein